MWPAFFPCGLLSVLCGCVDAGDSKSGGASKQGADALVVPDDEELISLSVDELVGLVDRLTAAASEYEASELGVRHATEGARVARSITRKGGPSKYLTRGRELLIM